MKIVSQVTILCVEDEKKKITTAFFSLHPEETAQGATKQEAIIKLLASEISEAILS